MKPQISVATIGHIDHGKSTLLGRLLFDSGQVKPEQQAEVEAAGGDFAFYLDAFQEERERGITMDAVYAHYESPRYIYNFIDDPGHQEFIKNMLTGASQASGVILVVSAQENERVQEQTKRHLNLAHLLGIKQILVVINKMDMVGYSQEIHEGVRKQISELLERVGPFQGPTLFIPTSASAGDNVFHPSGRLDWYHGPSLAIALDQTFTPPIPPVDRPLRGLIQRVLTRSDLVPGPTWSLTTKILAGKVIVGNRIYFPLADLEATVTAINSLGKSAASATVGESVGIKIDQDSSLIERGDVLCSVTDRLEPTTTVSGKIFVLSDHPLPKTETLGFRCGTREVGSHFQTIHQRIDSETGNVLEENAESLQPADLAVLALQLDQPVVVEEPIPELSHFILTQAGRPLAAGTTFTFPRG